MSGRRAEAARNDGRILDAARAVFLADPDAPVAKVAATAGVGISALYRRYPSKEHLLRALAEDGLTRYAASLESALASDADLDGLRRLPARGARRPEPGAGAAAGRHVHPDPGAHRPAVGPAGWPRPCSVASARRAAS